MAYSAVVFRRLKSTNVRFDFCLSSRSSACACRTLRAIVDSPVSLRSQPEIEPDPRAFSGDTQALYMPLTNEQKSPSQWVSCKQGDIPAWIRVRAASGDDRTRRARALPS